MTNCLTILVGKIFIVYDTMLVPYNKAHDKHSFHTCFEWDLNLTPSPLVIIIFKLDDEPTMLNLND